MACSAAVGLNIVCISVRSVCSIIVIQFLSHVQLFAAPWTAHASLSVLSWSLLTLISIEILMPANHLILCCPQSFPASGSFPVNQLLASDGQNIRASASASVLPMNIQG